MVTIVIIVTHLKGDEMHKSTVIKHFGNQSKAARALGLSHVAVGRWPETIPFERACVIQIMTNGQLEVDFSLYEINRPQTAA